MSQKKSSVVIVGGGASAVALVNLLQKSLSKLPPNVEIVVITGRDYYFHLIAGLRASVSGEKLADQIVIPYDKLIKDPSKVKIITQKAAQIKRDCVILEDGSRISFAYAVIATGKQWLPPSDLPDTRSEALQRMKEYRSKVAAARNILVIGGGAVGVEIASEIADSYSGQGKKITLIHGQQKLMNDTYSSKFRDGLEKQLRDLGVQMVLGDKVTGNYDFTSGPLDLTTQNGKTFRGMDLVIQATGGAVNTAPLRSLAPGILSNNGIKVGPTFQIHGFDNIFAMGDVADLPEQKQAAKINGHAAIVNKNLISLLQGKPASANYKAPGEMIIVNISDKGGMAYLELPLFGKTTMGPWMAKSAKSKTLFVPQARATLGY